MRRRYLFTILAAMVIAGLALAAASDTKFVGNGGMSVVGYTSVDAIAYGGGVTLELMTGGSGGTVVKTYYLRDSVGRNFDWTYYTGIDYAALTFTGASEAVLTPQ